MSVFIWIFIVLIALISILLITAIFIPKKYSVPVGIVIHRQHSIVKNYVSILKNQLTYSEWLNKDLEVNIELDGIDGTVGAMLKWQSYNQDKNVSIGMGEMKIISISEDEVNCNLQLIMPQPANCSLDHFFENFENDKTKYTCIFSTTAPYPWNLPSYIFGRKFIKTKQLKTLQNIKSILENGSN